MNVCCPCDVLEHPRDPDIAAGLPALPRQLAGFPEYRLALLREIPVHAALSGWRARGGDDLGIMLLEMWAYVLDVLGFYDERIANETYLRTAVLRPSLRKLVGLIGYQPRPALAASAILAAIADGHKSVLLPPRTGFRSDAFGGEAPQIFETEIEHTIHPHRNEWTVGPLRERTVGEQLLLEPDTARLARDQIAVFVWAAPTLQRVAAVISASRLEERSLFGAAAGRVVRADAVTAIDGETYIALTVEPAPRIGAGVRLADVQVLSPTLSSTVTALPGTVSLGTLAAAPVQFVARSFAASRPTAAAFDLSSAVPAGARIRLDAIYREVQPDDFVAISRGSEFRVFKIVDARETETTLVGETKIPVTEIDISPALPDSWRRSLRSLTVHFDMQDGGRLTRIARALLDAVDFVPPGLPLEGVVEPLPQGVSKPAELLLLDAQDNGALANGTVDIDATGAGKVQLAAGVPPFEPLLRTPVTVFGNLVRTTRGESVFDEVLGSGDASQTFQSFVLERKPLTYINDPAAPGGRRSTLEVRVNGVKWDEVASFFGIGPEREVYIVRQNDEAESVVTFGDGITGARVSTGIDNITATYRFGAGAAKPPAGAIGQLARPVEGLRRVVNPVAAGGGADADQPKDIRRNAPRSALILGRAVSVPDFEALAREFGGVINAHAEWAWDLVCQRAVVKVWFISDGGDIARALRAFLVGQADPSTPLFAIEADEQPSQLVLDLEVDDRFNPEKVIQGVRQQLVNSETGILALQNIPIGQALFRSRIFDIVLSVEGARSVRAITVDGQPAPFAITVGQGQYRNFLDGLIIGGSK